MKFKLYEDGCHYNTVNAKSSKQALKTAKENVDVSNYPETTKTFWVDVRAICEETNEEDSVEVQVDPREPECIKAEHIWVAPLTVVGGIKENPGVFGHGGGVIIKECCKFCGCQRITDTWAQNLSNGIQGLESVEYNSNHYTTDPNWFELYGDKDLI